MLILTIRTDKPEAEVGLFENNRKLAYEKWRAHRQLAETIHKKIQTLLKSQEKTWNDIESVICFKGPGSFTGLRIGLSVANTIALSQNASIVATSGKNWIERGVARLQRGEDEKVALPEYGAPVHITKPRK